MERLVPGYSVDPYGKGACTKRSDSGGYLFHQYFSKQSDAGNGPFLRFVVLRLFRTPLKYFIIMRDRQPRPRGFGSGLVYYMFFFL